VCLLVLETFVNPPVPGTDGGSEAIPFTASSYSQADDESPPPPPGTFIIETLMGQEKIKELFNYRHFLSQANVDKILACEHEQCV